MSEKTHQFGAPLDGTEPITDPTTLQSREGVRATTERLEHETSDHCGTGTIGRSAIDVRNDDGEHLLLVNDDLGIALLPHETLDAGDDWGAKAREGVAGQTGISASLDSVLAVRTVEHVLPDETAPHQRTHRIVFRGSPVDGEIRECKRSGEAGSDDWRAGWFESLPAGISPVPEGGPREDLQLVLD